jgi:hypothetical protein
MQGYPVSRQPLPPSSANNIHGTSNARAPARSASFTRPVFLPQPLARHLQRRPHSRVAAHHLPCFLTWLPSTVQPSHNTRLPSRLITSLVWVSILLLQWLPNPPQPQPADRQDPYYSHESIAKCGRFITHLFACPEYPPTSCGSSTKLPYFITYAFHRTELHTAVTFTAFILFQHLLAQFPTA